MPHWLIKSAIHRGISLLPQSQKWNELFQKKVTKSLSLGPGAFEARLKACRQYLDDFLELQPQCAETFTALELGTGWYPTVPIGLFLCGASEIWSFDIDPLLRRERLKVLLNYFADYDRKGILRSFLPRLRQERVALIHEVLKEVDSISPVQVLERLNIHAFVRDAQETGLKDRTIDLFFSYSVLEYIPAIVQKNLYAEFRRLGTVNATLIQFINLKDQYCDFDRSITPFNCLKYSSSAWKWFDSPLIPQTRLRISDYRKLLGDAGWKITKERNTSATLAELEKVRLAPEFQKYSKEDLLVITAWIVAKLAS